MTSSLQFKGALALVGAAATYASFGVLVRIMSDMFSDNAQVAFRFSLAFVFLGLIALLYKRPERLTRRQILLNAALAVSFCGVVLLYTIAANLTSLGNAVFLLYAGSIMSSLFIGTFFLKEKLNGTKLAAIALALIGLSMYSSAILALSVGVVAAVISGLLDGVSNSLRKMLKGINRNTSLLYQYAFGAAIALLVLAAWPAGAIREVSAGPVVAGVIFALLIIWLGNLLLYGFQHFDVNVGTVILATELVFAAILGYIFYQEVPAPNEIIGGAVIFAASILSAVDVPALLRRRRATS